MSSDRPWSVGDRVHGFAGGYLGRDSYACRTVEAIGRDWIVFRGDGDVVEFAAGLSLTGLKRYRTPVQPTTYGPGCGCTEGSDAA